MGIAVRDLLALEYFKDFYVIAGSKGLDKEIQGITTFEAPDACRWGKGKELILSSGYVISQEPDSIKKAFKEGNILLTSAMMIKRGRYLEHIPEEIIQLFEENNIPLISMPFHVAWMDIMSQVNVAVMNRTIRRFRIQQTDSFLLSGQTYKVQKIQRILQAVEIEMKFPAFLYDLSEERGYYSSVNFKRITENFGLKESDYWEPSLSYTKYTLCDYINMVRYRLMSQDQTDGPRVSWITIPITMNRTTRAYFVVMESKDFIDYYDEFSIRIAYLTLQGIYEQTVVAQNMGNIGFENFIHFALNYNETDMDKLMHQANTQGISMNVPYIYAVFHQLTPGISARSARKEFLEALHQSLFSQIAKLAFLDENEGVLFLEITEPAQKSRDSVKKLLENFKQHAEEKCSGISLEFGVCREESNLSELKNNIQKCREVLKKGKMLFPEEHIWDYETLGPLVWLNIPEEELAAMLKVYFQIMENEKNVELLRTLKIYLENNMNYSITAEKLYVHINTIRKRIDKIAQLLDTNWENPIERLKTELLLQYLKLDRL